MDELIVDSSRVIHMLLQWKALRLIALSCILPALWCRQQQQRRPRQFLRLGMESSLFSSLATGFRFSARWSPYLRRFQKMGRSAGRRAC